LQFPFWRIIVKLFHRTFLSVDHLVDFLLNLELHWVNPSLSVDRCFGFEVQIMWIFLGLLLIHNHENLSTSRCISL
jgi:hypothetical protein